jgi:hypothetical protein
MTARPYMPGVPAAGHVTGQGFWHPGAIEGCVKCTPKKEPSITCPECGRTSYNRHDIAQGYCGNCHAWTSKPNQGEHQ